MWLLADMMRTGMFLAGVALLTFVLLRRTYRHYGRRRSTRPGKDPYLATTPRPARDNRSLSDAPPEVLRWQVEIQETARALEAQLDSKMRALEQLIRDARATADRLDQLLAAAALPKPREPAVSPAEPTATDPDQEDGDASAGPHVGSVSEATWLAAFRLADNGTATAEIAQQLAIPLGELELLLRLRGGPQP